MKLMGDQLWTHPLICHGLPHIKGTRTVASQILLELVDGTSWEDISLKYNIPVDKLKSAVAEIAAVIDSPCILPRRKTIKEKIS